jgi:CIC family chloride channel protein
MSNPKQKKSPGFKIPSHFINGLLTVILRINRNRSVDRGGNCNYRISCTTQTKCFKEYKTELICAGIAAGITALFNSPIAGLFFCA